MAGVAIYPIRGVMCITPYLFVYSKYEPLIHSPSMRFYFRTLFINFPGILIRTLLLRSIFASISFLTLSQCAGVAGTSSCQVRRQGDLLIANVKTVGVECAGLPGRRGLTLGARETTIVQWLPAADAYGPPDSSRFGYLPSLPGRTLHISTVLHGMELSWDPTFAGFSFGFASRSACDLDPALPASFSLLIRSGAPEEFTLQPSSAKPPSPP